MLKNKKIIMEGLKFQQNLLLSVLLLALSYFLLLYGF